MNAWTDLLRGDAFAFGWNVRSAIWEGMEFDLNAMLRPYVRFSETCDFRSFRITGGDPLPGHNRQYALEIARSRTFDWLIHRPTPNTADFWDAVDLWDCSELELLAPGPWPRNGVRLKPRCNLLHVKRSIEI